MKLKQNAPLRLRINNTPTLLKPYSDKDTRILNSPKTFERQLTTPKSCCPIVIPNNLNNQNKKYFKKLQNYENVKKEEIVILNDNGKNPYEKPVKNKDSIINANDSISKTSSKNIVIKMLFD